MNTICQSCSMMMGEEEYGYNADGSRNTEYCIFCFPNGKFGKDETMEEMIESCIPFWVNDGDAKTPEEAREKKRKLFPTLNRWKDKGRPQ